MNAEPCEYCGCTYHAPWEDGLVECRNNLRDMLETATDNAVEWKTLAGQLRAQEAAIHGILADATDPYDAWQALEQLRALVSTPASPKEEP